MSSGDDRFGQAVEAAAWLSVMLRVVQFLAFAPAAAWRKATFLVLAAALALVAITSGLRMT